jgi:DNA mismatch repair protein MSH2
VATLALTLTLPQQELIESFKQFEAMVETMVDLSLIDQHEYRIRPDFDDDLKEFYKGLQKSKRKMEELQTRVRLPLKALFVRLFRVVALSDALCDATLWHCEQIAEELELDTKELKLESSKHVGYYFRLTAKVRVYVACVCVCVSARICMRCGWRVRRVSPRTLF